MQELVYTYNDDFCRPENFKTYNYGRFKVSFDIHDFSDLNITRNSKGPSGIILSLVYYLWIFYFKIITVVYIRQRRFGYTPHFCNDLPVFTPAIFFAHPPINDVVHYTSQGYFFTLGLTRMFSTVKNSEILFGRCILLIITRTL